MRSDCIKLRWKSLGNGKESAFLDITIPGRPRKKEYLRIYRGGEIGKRESKDATRLASAICEKRLQEYRDGLLGIEQDKSYKLYFPFYAICANLDGHAENTRLSWINAGECLKKYLAVVGKSEETFVFADIDYEFCNGYLSWLKNDATSLPKKWHGQEEVVTKRLKLSTVITRFSIFKSSIDMAIREGIMKGDPTIKCVMPKVEKAKKEYLSPEDLRLLMKTPYTNENTCKAFMFSCLTGLRISDIRAMRWSDVTIHNGRTRITFRQKKTGGLVYLDISDMAAGYMGNRGELKDNVFDVQKGTHMYESLRKWVANAGIDKYITFHCGRHTAAVSMLTAGAEIYTVQRVLGHASLSSTQVYADIIDAQKTSAVDMIASLVEGHNRDK